MKGRLLAACWFVAVGCASARPDPSPGEGMPAGPPADAPPAETPPVQAPPVQAPPIVDVPAVETPPVVDVPPVETPPVVDVPPPADPEIAARQAVAGVCKPASWQMCQLTLAAMRGQLVSADAQAIVKDLDQRVAIWSVVAPGTIGVLLPLSGPHAKAGEAAREAIELAVADRTDVRLVIRDTAEDPIQAAAEAEKLLANDHVVALLGPIGRKETSAVAAIARRYAVPHVVLATAVDAAPDGIGAGEDPVVRTRTSAVEIAEAMARHAKNELGITRVAVMYPQSDAGTEAANAFAAEIVRLGGEVATSVAYPAGDGDKIADFKPALQALTHAEKPGKSVVVDFDALFIPDQAVVVRRLAPILKSWGIVPRTDPSQPLSPPPATGKGGGKSKAKSSFVKRVQLLGASGWGSPAVIERGEGLTDNAIFGDVWVADDPANADFVTAFGARFAGRKPTAFHAEAFAATRLLTAPVAAAKAVDQTARNDVRARLAASGAKPPVHIMTIDRETLRPRLPEADEKTKRAAR